MNVWSLPRIFCTLLMAAALGMAVVAGARAESGYAGRYVAAPARIEAVVGVWGGDCGARPQSYTASEQPQVEVRDQGAHLALVYPDRTLRTSGCWSPNPTVKLTSTSAADNRWRTECRTPQGEARKETGRYTVIAKGKGVLELLEESEYDWRLNESHCVAQVRITQRLERTGAGGAAKPTKESEPECVAGAAVRLKLRPVEARLEPGGRVCFQPRGVDAEGCSVDVAPGTLRWELIKPSASRGTLSENCFKAADAAADGEGTFEIVADGAGLRAVARVTVVATDLSDITARRSSTTSGVTESAPAIGGGLAGAGVKAVGVDARTNLPLMIAVGLLALALIGGSALWLLRARKHALSSQHSGSVMPRESLEVRRSSLPAAPATARSSQPAAARGEQQARPVAFAPRTSAPPESAEVRDLKGATRATRLEAAPRFASPDQAAQPHPARVAAAFAVPAPAVAAPAGPAPTVAAPSGEALICPTCRRGFAPGNDRCSVDGSGLLPYSDYVRKAKQAEVGASTCPGCGTQVAAGAAFCGVCGQRLSS